jgi:hypothetical protein
MPPKLSLSRKGSVLQSETILKDCFFKAITDNEKLTVIEGAPNFTKIGGFPVACMAQPDINGIYSVLHLMNSQEGKSKICWISFQVEPVVYLQSSPFVVRDSQHPFQCLKEFNFALSANRMYQISKRLKSDIISELLLSEDSTILVHRENENMELLETKLKVQEAEIRTVDEVFKDLSSEFSLEYIHIPIATEDIPNVECFDFLFQAFEKSVHDSSLIFNCQMGRGRSTFGMVASIIFMNRKGVLNLRSENL